MLPKSRLSSARVCSKTYSKCVEAANIAHKRKPTGLSSMSNWTAQKSKFRVSWDRLVWWDIFAIAWNYEIHTSSWTVWRIGLRHENSWKSVDRQAYCPYIFSQKFATWHPTGTKDPILPLHYCNCISIAIIIISFIFYIGVAFTIWCDLSWLLICNSENKLKTYVKSPGYFRSIFQFHKIEQLGKISDLCWIKTNYSNKTHWIKCLVIKLAICYFANTLRCAAK